MLKILKEIVVYNDIGKNWGISLQEEGSTIMVGIRELYDHAMYYIVWIVLLVSNWLILDVIEKTRKVSMKYVSHNSILELIWTISPGIILIWIAIPSFKLLYSMDEIIKPNITLKVKGYQWYWGYNIDDIDGIGISYDSYTLKDEDIKEGDYRLLDVDNRIILPIETPIRVLTTAEDVIHSWAIPSLGIKIDAIPGRINQVKLYILRPGIYYGQCSELCGQLHGGMSIVIEGVSMKEYIGYIISNSNISTSKLIKIIKSIKEYIL